MITKFKRIIGLIACLCLCLCFFACGETSLSIAGKNRISIEAGTTYTLKVSGLPAGSTAEWESSDESVATVAAGKVTGIKEGEAVITVKADGATASVTVAVRDTRKYSVTLGDKLYTLKYGEKVEKPADPVKEADAQYTYTFKGWFVGDKQYDFSAPVTENLFIEAVFDKTVNQYDVKIGSAQAVKYDYGSLIESPANPTKASTAQYDYVFKGWYNGENKWNFASDRVTENVTLTAEFQEVVRSYKVTFGGKNATYVKYGEKLEKPADPVMAANAQYTYKFLGWYNGDKKWNFETDTVSATTELTAKYEEILNEYTVTVGEKEYTLAYGTKIQKPATPVKEADAQYTYEFKCWMTESGEIWDFDNDTVIGTTTLIADWTRTLNKYTVTVDGAEAEYAYGSKVVRPATPVKEPDGENTYYFDKFVVEGTETEWNFDRDVVTGDLKLVALFKKTTNKYLVSFGGIRFAEYAYGEKIEKPEDPTRDSDNQNEYYFDHWEYEENGVKKTWDFENDTVTESKPGTLTPVFTAQSRAYTVSFVSDGVEFAKSPRTRVGEKISAPQANPEKASSATQTYTFAGWYNGSAMWDFENDTVNGPLTLTARYEVSVRLYNVVFKNGEEEPATTTCKYGSTIVAPAAPASYTEGGYKYEFVGWVNAKGEQWNFTTGIVTEDLVLSAKFNPAPIVYEVKYEDEYGNLIYVFNIKEGERVPEVLSYSKEANVRYTYNFRFWTADGETAYDFENAEVTADMVLSPVFEAVVRQYTVTLKNYDGVVFDTMTFEYGTAFEYPVTAELPIKDIEGDENSYAFEYWSETVDGEKFVGEVTANITLYAIYKIDNNEYTVVYYDYTGAVIEGATQTGMKYNKMLTLPDATRENTKETRYTFIGWATEEGGALVYPAGKPVRCAGDMTMYPLYEEETMYYYVTMDLTDADNNYVITDAEGNALTEADLKFTYNQTFSFKAQINEESKGSIVIKRGSTTLSPDENGVYSFNVRDEIVRVSISGLTLRRYTVTDKVTLAKQSDAQWAHLIDNESDIIVKLTANGEEKYIENAVSGGVMTVSGLVAGDYTVEYVAMDSEGNYRNISASKYNNVLNVEWAIANNLDESLTWTLDGSLVGTTPITINGDYKWMGDVIKAETYHDTQNGNFKLNELVPATNDFVTTVTYNQPFAGAEDEGPSTGFYYTTEDGTQMGLYFLNEGKIRFISEATGWDSRIETHNMICNVGAILNKYGDCYTRVTVTHVKKGDYLYMFGSFSRPNSNVVAITDRLLAVIDTATGTLYTNSQINGSSFGTIQNPLAETGTYQVFQNDELKKLANIKSVEAYFGITQASPIEVYGLNYSLNASDIARYTDMAETKVQISMDDHVNVRVNNPTGKQNVFNAWQEGSLKFVPDKGYVIDTVTVNGKTYASSVNKDGHYVLNFVKDFVGQGTLEVKVTSKAGSYNGWTVVTGQVNSDGAAMANATVAFEKNGQTHSVTADANGKYEIMLPAGTYNIIASEKAKQLQGYAIGALPTAFDSNEPYSVSGTAATKDIELDTIIGGYNIGDVKHGDLNITYSGTSNEDFKVTVQDLKNTWYQFNRKLADGQMISFSLKFNEMMGIVPETGENKAQWQDAYLKFNVGGKDIGIGSHGDMWNGTRVNETPFAHYAWLMQQGIYDNVYDFAYARQGNRVYLLVKYNVDEQYTALSYVDVTDEKAAIMLNLTGRAGQIFDFTYSNFGFIGDKAEVDALIAAAKGNKSTSKTRNIGTPDKDGKYNVYINGNYGVAITDKIYDKTQGSAVITAKVNARLQGYGFVGFMMRDPVTGNFVNFGIHEVARGWRTSVQAGNGWNFRSGWILDSVEQRIPDFNIGNGKNECTTEFTLKAIVSGDHWTVFVNDQLAGTIDLRAFYEKWYIGGGASSLTVSGNAKHGWKGDTENLYPTADKVQLGFYAFADTIREVYISDISLELCPDTLIAGAYVDNLESVKNSEDLVYTMYNDNMAGSGNTVPMHSTKGIKDGEAMLFTMQYNEAEGNRKAHATRVQGDAVWGDKWINLGIDGKAYRITSSGCTAGSWDNTNYPSATAKNNIFDFAMDRDMWNSNPQIVTKYDFAIVKNNGKVDLYGKYHGASEWAIMYTADSNKPLTYIDVFQMTSIEGFVFNFSLTGVKIVGCDDVLSHVWDYKSAFSTYASAAKNINEDGSTGYYMHIALSGTKQWTQSRYRAIDVYNAKDNTVVIDGDYSMFLSDANWSIGGWNFADATVAKKAFSIGIRTEGANNKFVISYATDWIDNYGKRFHSVTAADPEKGLLVCNPNYLGSVKYTLNQFSARWVINGYRYQLYVGAYGQDPDTLILDIDVKTYMTNYRPNEGNDNMLWGGSDEFSADKCVPDMSAFRYGIVMSTDCGPRDTVNLPGSQSLFYGENVTAKEVYTGSDLSLTGPAYKLVTDENGNRITSDYWYAEAEFTGSVKGSGWAGIITDMCGNATLDTSDKEKTNTFFGTGYGYGQVYVHAENMPWWNGKASGAFTTGDVVKIGTARIGNKVYVYIDDILRGSYYVTDKPSNIGLYAGTGSENDVQIKNFTYTTDKAAVDAKMKSLSVSVTKNINGKNYNLTMAEMGGFFGNDIGGHYKSFGANYTITGRDSADMSDITFSYAGGATGNIYYMEAEFTNKNGYNGIICNTFDVPHKDNGVYYGVGFGYGNDTSTQLYLHSTVVWGGQGDSLGSFPIDGNETVRLGIARINTMYYVFLDGKFATSFAALPISTQNTNNIIAYDNISGMGIFNDVGPNKVGKFSNAAYTTDEATVRAICAGVKTSSGFKAWRYVDNYSISGKMDIKNPGNGNRFIGFNLSGGNNRFLLWDKNASGMFEYAYSKEGSHIHYGNLPASQYLKVENGKTTTIDWKVIHDGKNGYFLINGEVKLVYTNAVKGDKFQIEVVNVDAKVYNVEVVDSANAENWQAELDSIAEVRAGTQMNGRAIVRPTLNDSLEISHGSTSGSTFHEFINPIINGTADNYIYETTLVVEECGNNAHFGIEFPGDSCRFLFWRTGDDQSTLKVTWAYDGGWSSSTKYQLPLTGTYKMKVVVKDGSAYWFVNGTLMCAIKANGQLSLRFEAMKGHTENSTVISKLYDEAAFTAAINALNLPAITGPTRF